MKARGRFALCLVALLSLASPANAEGAPSLAFSPFMVGLSVADMDKVTDWYVGKLGFRVAFLRDPEGNMVEILQRLKN
ncbi:MAG: hypothetical protein J0I80_04160 [Sphingomonas sp.]|mgnify:CR=1 FL=1|nr:hypothetical protein [Sphingomonas sp.]